MMYILYDTALNGLYTLSFIQKKYSDNISIFKGTKDEKLFDVAPYLIKADERFYENINAPFVSLEAIVIVESDEKINTLHTHFSNFIYQDINSRKNYFRFWDARVLTRFLPVSTNEILNSFFDCIKSFYIPDRQNKTAIKYFIKRGKLQSDKLLLNKLFILEDDNQDEVHAVDDTESNQNIKTKRTFFN